MAAFGNFVKDDGRYKTVKPYIYYGPDKGFPNSNLALKESPLSLIDLRTVPEFKPTIESHGFCFIENESEELPKLTNENDSQPYVMEMAKVLKKLLGATLAIPVQTRVWSPFLFFPRSSALLMSANVIIVPSLIRELMAVEKLEQGAQEGSSWD